MSSWIKCSCGNDVHKNLFCGADVSVLIIDNELDKLDDSLPSSQTISQIIAKGDILVKCNNCGRLMIESKDTGKISAYIKEDQQER